MRIVRNHSGGLAHVLSRTFDEVQDLLAGLGIEIACPLIGEEQERLSRLSDDHYSGQWRGRAFDKIRLDDTDIVYLLIEAWSKTCRFGLSQARVRRCGHRVESQGVHLTGAAPRIGPRVAWTASRRRNS